jgi:hypothetical protein
LRATRNLSAAAIASLLAHLIADHYPDASDVPDEEWIAEGCAQGWVLLTKDQRIRSRAAELEALQEGHLFCLVSGNLDIDGMTQAFLDALPTIERLAREEAVGFWHVYRDGQVKRMWP